ncbi:hypothetical protein BJ138DRAFT_1168621 [Hygrophoropsis aurantiaca]|uniref:Uncharacterized protein n=1 Tax=Hygrophoropsis aurantiaca TaxID=72124 RepID=A0ACB7ZQJ2_9AGAM|nr:hypothetical protein BJ138DRAFT_1168621 [Hygrophoropsis aurantiaca]
MSWTPDETPTQLAIETAWLQGYVAAGVVYGVVVVLFVVCFYRLWERIRTKRREASTNFMLLYLISVFGFATVVFATNSKFVQLAFINNRDYPGGPGAYTNAMFSIPVNLVSSIAYLLANWCATGLMLWRCIVIHQNCGPMVRRSIYGGLGLVVMGFTTISLLWLVQVCSPASSPSQNTLMAINYTTPFFSTALATNVITTILIAARILIHRHETRRKLHPEDYISCSYTGVPAIIIESASIYTAFYLLFIISFATNSVSQMAFLQVVSHMDTLASFLIIYRVLQGKAWTRETFSRTAEVMSDRHDISLQTQMFSRPLSPMRFKQPPVEVQVSVDVSELHV